MSKIRLRQKQLLLAGAIGGTIVLLLTLGGGYLYVSKLQSKYEMNIVELENKLSIAEKQLNQEKETVTVLNADYRAGEILKEQDLVTVSLPKVAVPKNFANLQDAVGKYMKIDLDKNALVTKNMLYEEGITPDDLRNQEFRLIQLPMKLFKNDFVDVRIKFPTGQDFIVLSKKKVEDLNNQTIWYHMNEKEILTMSSAIVDAYLQDATIYALSYVEPYLQTQAIITYPPNLKVQELISSDPNIVNVATMYLEKKAREKLESDMKSMTDEERQKYLSGKTAEEQNNAGVSNYNGEQQNNTSEQNSLFNSNQNEVKPNPDNIFKDHK
ncbi:hypothetical protein J2Z32_000019 [Paenibacillus turicensis]|uniref:SAF domain-containing protein n=1 Tax=Paenibacillus turicensis TaxID=160487 RepID=A0ABS4FLF2_9BACL|nr:SAF domain-containing protein [Paenibacillus turicensis]MBP1903407.1 hypothetical protein [Paenibacillus turicensis]